MVRLFMSVDMVGSTLFKSRLTGQGSGSWLKTFQTFFTSFPLMVAGQIGFQFLEDEHTPAVDVWKVMGDEVVFVTQPASPEEATSTLIALLRTMKLYEEKHLPGLPLRLKGTAWLADFDGQNIEIEIPELSSSDTGRHVDFIGPDIDLGFRIAKFARPSCLVVSLDLLEVILGSRNVGDAALYLMGREDMKGVMFGRPYPIVWMHDATEGFDFLPWEVEQDPMMQKAVSGSPTPPAELRRVIGDMRQYLKKMHAVDRPPFKL